MKRFGPLAFLTLLVATIAYAATTYTTNYNLAKPGDGDKNYGEALRDNFDTIDTQLKLNADTATDHINDTTDAHNASAISTTAGSFLCTTSTNVQDYLDCLDGTFDPTVSGAVLITGSQTITGAKTFSALTVLSGGATVTDPVTLSSILAAELLKTNVSGQIEATSLSDVDPLTTKGDLLGRDNSTTVRVPVGTDGQYLTADSTDAEGVVWTTPNPRWRKLELDYSDFSAAAGSFSLSTIVLAAKEGVSDVIIKHNTAFGGGSITTYTVEVGYAGDTDAWAGAFDVFQAPADTLSQSSMSLEVPDFANTTTVLVTATADADLDEATTGSVDVYIRTFVLP